MVIQVWPTFLLSQIFGPMDKIQQKRLEQLGYRSNTSSWMQPDMEVPSISSGSLLWDLEMVPHRQTDPTNGYTPTTMSILGLWQIVYGLLWGLNEDITGSITVEGG